MDENERYYVRAAVGRGMMQLERDIEEGKRYLATDPPATFRQSIEGMVAYNEQMLREMKQYIPEELQ